MAATVADGVDDLGDRRHIADGEGDVFHLAVACRARGHTPGVVDS